MAISVVVAEDHKVVRDGLRSIFSTVPDISLVAEAEDGMEAADLVKRVRPDVLVLTCRCPASLAGRCWMKSSRVPLRQRSSCFLFTLGKSGPQRVDAGGPWAMSPSWQAHKRSSPRLGKLRSVGRTSARWPQRQTHETTRSVGLRMVQTPSTPSRPAKEGSWGCWPRV